MNSTVQKLNSLVPFMPTTVKNNSKVATVVPMMNSSSAAAASSSGSGWMTPLFWFLALVLVFLGIFSFYYEPFMDSIQNWTDSFNSWLTGKTVPPPEVKKNDIPVAPPVAPQDEGATKPTGMHAMVEKMLPPAKEVFTISKNDYSFYDAAPLCKALGAELATYDQVKHAWQKGADWCNYGWVKGQMAVFPTQESTYEELQQGPDDQKGVCGKPGLNGGYFDNPELKFGVTCVGKRPSQSQHDATAISAGATRPLTASGIEFEKKVMRFKEGSDSLGILPFNKEHWGS